MNADLIWMQIMKRKFLLGVLAVVIGVIGIVIVLANENALVVHPKGIIAQSELELIITNIILMLLIIVPNLHPFIYGCVEILH